MSDAKKKAEFEAKIAEIRELDGKIDTLSTQRSKLHKEIHDEFLCHPQWSMFLDRHGVGGFSDDMGGYQYYDFTFYEDGTCEIECRDVFRGELVEDRNTRRFKVSELIDFLANDKYYNPLLDRFNSIKECITKKVKEENDKAEFNLYQRLKAKYEK